MNEYQKKIGTTYYHQNYFNVGAAASNYFDNHGEQLQIILPNGKIILSTIKRLNNNNASVRFYGGVEWHQFIQDNYNLNNTKNFEVTNPTTITILPNAQ